jgi:hypothetical protein
MKNIPRRACYCVSAIRGPDGWVRAQAGMSAGSPLQHILRVLLLYILLPHPVPSAEVLDPVSWFLPVSLRCRPQYGRSPRSAVLRGDPALDHLIWPGSVRELGVWPAGLRFCRLRGGEDGSAASEAGGARASEEGAAPNDAGGDAVSSPTPSKLRARAVSSASCACLHLESGAAPYCAPGPPHEQHLPSPLDSSPAPLQRPATPRARGGGGKGRGGTKRSARSKSPDWQQPEAPGEDAAREDGAIAVAGEHSFGDALGGEGAGSTGLLSSQLEEMSVPGPPPPSPPRPTRSRRPQRPERPQRPQRPSTLYEVRREGQGGSTGRVRKGRGGYGVRDATCPISTG